MSVKSWSNWGGGSAMCSVSFDDGPEISVDDIEISTEYSHLDGSGSIRRTIALRVAYEDVKSLEIIFKHKCRMRIIEKFEDKSSFIEDHFVHFDQYTAHQNPPQCSLRFTVLPEFQPAGYEDSLKRLRGAIPALDSLVTSPCDCGVLSKYWFPVSYVVMHLNDTEKWSRERIADWLDTLDLDLSFPVPDKIPGNIN